MNPAALIPNSITTFLWIWGLVMTSTDRVGYPPDTPAVQQGNPAYQVQNCTIPDDDGAVRCSRD